MARRYYRDVARNVENFSQKELSFSSDSLLAFSGIMERYIRAGIEFFHGLPVSVESDEVFRTSFALSLASWAHISFLSQASPTESHQRLAHLPSWTWAGWKGSITWRIGEKEPRDYAANFDNVWRHERSTKVTFGNGNDTSFTANPVDRMMLIRITPNKSIHSVLTIRNPSILQTCNFEWKLDQKGNHCWFISGYRVWICLSERKSWVDFKYAVDEGIYKCVLMFWSLDAIRFLVLKRAGTKLRRTWERVGIIVVENWSKDRDCQRQFYGHERSIKGLHLTRTGLDFELC